MEVKLSYIKDFDCILLNVVVGGNCMCQFICCIFVEINGGLVLEGFYNISNFLVFLIVLMNEQQWGINSVFGLVFIGFDNWLYMDIMVCNDWFLILFEGENFYFYLFVLMSVVIFDLLVFGGVIGLIFFVKVCVSYVQVGLDVDFY